MTLDYGNHPLKIRHIFLCFLGFLFEGKIAYNPSSWKVVFQETMLYNFLDIFLRVIETDFAQNYNYKKGVSQKEPTSINVESKFETGVFTACFIYYY